MPYLRQRVQIWVLGLGMLLAFQAAGWYLSWGILMLDAKMAVSQKLSRPETVREQLTVSTADLSRLWVGKREIRRNGRLYDVCSQHPQGDSVRLEIFHDTREEAILATLFALFVAEENSGKVHYDWLCHLLEATYLLPVLPVLPQRQTRYLPADFSYWLLRAQHDPAQTAPPPKS